MNLTFTPISQIALIYVSDILRIILYQTQHSINYSCIVSLYACQANLFSNQPILNFVQVCTFNIDVKMVCRWYAFTTTPAVLFPATELIFKIPFV